MPASGDQTLAAIIVREHEDAQRRRREVDALKTHAVRTLGLRAVATPALVRLREALNRPGTPSLPGEPITIARAEELAHFLRLRTTLDSTTGDGLIDEDATARRTRVQPNSGGVARLVPVVPCSTLLARSTFIGLPGSGAAGGADEGQALSLLTNIDITTGTLPLKPWGVAGEVTRDTLADAGSFARVLDQVMRRGFMSALSAQILSGDGSDDGAAWQFTGVTNLSGVTTITRAAETRATVLAEGAEAVQTNGYGIDDGDLTLIASPATMRAILTETDANGEPLRPRDLLPVSSYVTSLAIADGSAVIGDFRDGSALFMNGDVTLTLAPEHSDFFTTGKALAAIDVPTNFDAIADAFAVIDGL